MKCAFCGDKELLKFAEKKSPITGKKVFYYRCLNCSSVHQHPLPKTSVVEKYYENYLKIKGEMNPGYLEEKNKLAFFCERDKTLSEIGFDASLFKNGKNVEIGCATGDFLEYMSLNGAKHITGVDTSSALIKKIKIKGAKVIKGDISKMKNKSIDNLFAFNVLEHIPDVEQTMEEYSGKLANDGVIVLELPISGFISGFFKSEWRFLMPDEHLHIPSEKGLKIFLKRYGFKIRGRTRFGSGFTKGSINDTVKSLLDCLVKIFKLGDRGAFLIRR
jgi:SAM-dependent methyltransferase